MNVEGLLPATVQENVSIAPPNSWVHLREDEINPASLVIEGTNPVLLIDRQYDVDQRETYQRIVRRLDTMQAVHEAAQWRMSFDPGVHRLTIHSLTIWRDGVSRDLAHRDSVRLLQREESLDHLVIDGWVTAVVLLEDVRVGDLVDTSHTLAITPRLLPENYWFFATVPEGFPLHRFRLSVRFPAGRTLQWKSSAKTLEPAVTEGEAETVWTWIVEKPPLVELEAGVPSWYLVNQWVQVSDLASWGEVSAGVLAAWTEQFDNPEVLRIAGELAAASTSLEDRASRALTFIQDEIRYLSLETGVGGQIPSSPGTVLRRRFGDCKDKSFLAAHLLRRLGIPARPVLVSTGLRQTIRDLLPMPDAFDHAVVEFEIEGHRRWVDTTLPQQGGGALSRPTPPFHLGLPIAPGVVDLEALPTPPSTRTLYELRETFFLDTSGRTSTLMVALTTHGRDAENLRRSFAHEGAEAVARQRERFYQQFFPEMKRVGKLEWRDDRERNELTLKETYDGTRLLGPGPDAQTAVFQFPIYSVRSLLSLPQTARRRQPFALPYPCNIEHIIQIESPGIERATGLVERSDDAAFQFSLTTTQTHGRFIAKYLLRTLRDSVAPEKFQDFTEKVGKAWPWTALTYPLRLGIAVPWNNRQGASLRHRHSASEEKRERAASMEPAPGIGAPAFLASEVAPPLGSLERTASESPAKTSGRPNPKVRPPRAETPAAEPRLLSPVSALPRSRRRRRSRQSDKSDNREIWIGVGIAVTVLFLLVVIYFYFR